MPRQPRPWRRKGRPGWWTQINGKRVCLSRDGDREEAQRALYRHLIAAGQVTPDEDRLTIARAADLYLDHCRQVNRPKTYEVNKLYLQTAIDFRPDKTGMPLGSVLVSELRPSQVDKWLASRKVSSATKRIMLGALRTAVNWCRREGYLSRPDCLSKVKTPAARKRDRTLSPEERQKFLQDASPALRDFLIAISETGARPFVLRTLEARHIDWGQGTATLESKGRSYVLILTGTLHALLARLANLHPEGPLLRSTSGRPWTVNSLRCAVSRLRQRTGIANVIAYTYRHSYATDALEKGLNAAVVGQLLNHTDLNMISKHYGHLADRRASLKAAAELAAKAGRTGDVTK